MSAAASTLQLRSSRQGHAANRHIAQEIFRKIERVHPQLAKYICVDLTDYRLARG